MTRGTVVAFLIFFVGYTLQKYVAAAPPAFSWDYFNIVLFIAVITALIPFAVVWAVGRSIRSLSVFALFSLIAMIGLSSLAFLAYWYFTVSHYPDAPPARELARRGIAPGVFMAAILIASRWLADRRSRS